MNIEPNTPEGKVALPRLVLPLMMLDESMPELHSVPIHSETGEVSEEKMWEILELAEAWVHESDDDLRKQAQAKYEEAIEGVKFDLRPLFKQSSFMLGAAYKDLSPPREMYHCHPNTWEKVPDEEKAKFEVRVDAGYSFLGQNAEATYSKIKVMKSNRKASGGRSSAPCSPSFVPFGPEWEKEVMQHRKADLVKMFSKACRDRDGWKASHDNQVELKRIISARPDMAERAPMVEKLMEEKRQAEFLNVAFHMRIRRLESAIREMDSAHGILPENSFVEPLTTTSQPESQ